MEGLAQPGRNEDARWGREEAEGGAPAMCDAVTPTTHPLPPAREVKRTRRRGSRPSHTRFASIFGQKS